MEHTHHIYTASDAGIVFLIMIIVIVLAIFRACGRLPYWIDILVDIIIYAFGIFCLIMTVSLIVFAWGSSRK